VFSSDPRRPHRPVEAFAGRVHLGGIRLELERVEVCVIPPRVSIRLRRESWVDAKEHAIEGASAVFSADTAELLITSPDATMVVEGARLLAV